MHGVLIALGAELLRLKAIWIVAAILLGDVVAILAFFARHGDLRSYVAGLGHLTSSSLTATRSRDICRSPCGVAEAGFEPATQRL